MRCIRLLKKFSNVFFIPMLVGVVCMLIFKDVLNTFKYAQLIRYLLLVVCIIVILGALVKNKNEKDN